MFESELKVIHANSYSEKLNILFNHIGVIENKVVLEAGCGSTSILKYKNCEIFGIDISQKQLSKNSIIQHKIVADLIKYKNENWNNKFDLIVCYNVLEHLSNPAYALENFAKWLKIGGGLILAFPIPNTIIGLITKYTPLWIHYFGRVLTYLKYDKTNSFFGYWKIAKESTFPTVYDKILNIDYLFPLLKTLSLNLELFISIESSKNRIIREYLGQKIYSYFWRKINKNRNNLLSPLATDVLLYLRKI